MSDSAHARLHRSVPRTLRIALAVSLALHLAAFVWFPSPRPSAAAGVPPTEELLLVETAEPVIVPEPPAEVAPPRIPAFTPDVEPVPESAPMDPVPQPELSPPEAPAPDSGPASGFRVYDEPPRVLRRVHPAYPDLARELGVEGEVAFDVTVSAAGRVESVVLVASAARWLTEPAREALKAWTFAPALQSGIPVRATVRIRLRFSLDS